MARVVSSAARGGGRTSTTVRMPLSEVITTGLIIALLAFGARYYFLVYRKSPSYVLGNFLAAIKDGNAQRQYDLFDSDIKQVYPSYKDYENSNTLAHGYSERIMSVSMTPEKIDPARPTVAAIDVTIGIRKAGQKVYEAGSDTFTDHYKLRKDKDGDWKIWLNKSTVNITKATPNPKVEAW